MDAFAVTLTSAGLTTASTAYTAGDMLGSIWSDTSFTSGASGIITGVTLVDKAKVVAAVDLYLFDASVSQAANNAANSWSDTDMLKCEGIVNMPAPIASALNSTCHVDCLVPFKLAGTGLYVCAVTRAAHTWFGAVGDLQIKLRGYTN